MLLAPNFDSTTWARENFRGCDLGDQRRSRRLVKFARQAADRPAATLPKMGEDWGGTRGIYRLLDCPEATLESVTKTHREKVTRQKGRFFVLSDTSHIDFGRFRDLPDSGPVGPGGSQGFLLHSGLLVDAGTDSLIGLGGQVAHIRSKARKKKLNDAQRCKRWRESEMWAELFEQIGSPPEGSQYVHVCDSAADTFEVFCTATRLNCDFAIRVGRRHRKVIADGEKKPLSEAIADAQELGRYELELSQTKGRPSRAAKLKVSSKRIQVPVPKHCSRRVKDYVGAGGSALTLSAVVVEETDPPAGVEPICWLLLTTVPVEDFESAWEVIRAYENRWLVEEWHKAIKTGCRLESRQLQSTDRLLPLTGVLSVVAVMLVQIKHVARQQPDRPALKYVPKLWLQLLKAKKKISHLNVSSREFWHAMAKVGGFLGRRHDGEPGWELIWRGWRELLTLAEGAKLCRKCG